MKKFKSVLAMVLALVMVISCVGTCAKISAAQSSDEAELFL